MIAIPIAVIAVGILSLLAWLTYGRIDDTKALATERVSHEKTVGQLERRSFELEVTQKALVAANKRAEALEEVLQDEVDSSPNPDLSRTDIRNRVLRIARKWAEAAATRSPLPANPDEAVSDKGATAAASPAGVRVVDDPDGLMQP